MSMHLELALESSHGVAGGGGAGIPMTGQAESRSIHRKGEGST